MHVYCCNTDNDVGGDDSQQGDMLKCHLEVLHVAFDGREKKEMGDNGRREDLGEDCAAKQKRLEPQAG